MLTAAQRSALEEFMAIIDPTKLIAPKQALKIDYRSNNVSYVSKKNVTIQQRRIKN